MASRDVYKSLTFVFVSLFRECPMILRKAG